MGLLDECTKKIHLDDILLQYSIWLIHVSAYELETLESLFLSVLEKIRSTDMLFLYRFQHFTARRNVDLRVLASSLPSLPQHRAVCRLVGYDKKVSSMFHIRIQEIRVGILVTKSTLQPTLCHYQGPCNEVV